jgi:DNA-binding transcriptional regulator YiaG
MANQVKIYIWQTRDKYQLPLFVTDSLEELSKICEKTKDQILSLISHYHNGDTKNCAFDRVIIEEEEMNWIKKAMDEKEVSIEELADALGLTWGTVRNYYRGWTKPGKNIRLNIIRILELDEEEVNERERAD